MQRDSFKLSVRKKSLFDKLSCIQAGQLIKAIFTYIDSGERPDDSIIDLLLEDFIVDFDKEDAKTKALAEKRRECGQRGAEKRWSEDSTKAEASPAETAKNTATKQSSSATPAVAQPVQGVLALTNDTEDTDIDFEKFKAFWNAQMRGKGLGQIVGIKNNRRMAINARRREYGKQAVFQVITKAAASTFLNSGRFGIDWVFRPNNFPKVLEGNYDNDKMQPQTPTAAPAKNIKPTVFDVREDILTQLKLDLNDGNTGINYDTPAVVG